MKTMKCILIGWAFFASIRFAGAQLSTISYQGRLTDSAGPVNGDFQMQFAIYNAPTGSASLWTEAQNSVAVSNGLFTVTLGAVQPLDATVFDGGARWMEIDLRPSGTSDAFTKISPRQPLTAVPYAITAAHLSGTDNQPLELRVNNERALRLEPSAGTPNVVIGDSHNSVRPGVVGASITGGGAADAFGGPRPNQIAGDYGVIAGGLDNVVGDASPFWELFQPPYGYKGNYCDWGYCVTNGVAAAVSAGRANRAFSDYSVISGGFSNTIARFSEYSSIAGGRENTVEEDWWNDEAGRASIVSEGVTISGGARNRVRGSYSRISGGQDNHAAGYYVGIGGGLANSIWSGWANTIGGGEANAVGGAYSGYSTIAGGYQNVATLAHGSTISGGTSNLINWYAEFGTIGGGASNAIASSSIFATIPGGDRNFATNRAFAAGTRAKARHTGAFVWADSQDTDFASSGDNQFCVRASQGVRLHTNTSLYFGNQSRQMLNLWTTEYGLGVQDLTLYCRSFADFSWFRQGSHHNGRNNPGGGTELMRLDLNGNLKTLTGTIAGLSDRAAKTNFLAVTPREILEKVVALPISTWNYKTHDPSQRHIGPTAQDFYAAFKVGLDEKSICTVDADGVALAAIQGLNELVREKEARIAALEEKMQHVHKLEQRLEKLEKLLVSLTQKEGTDENIK